MSRPGLADSSRWVHWEENRGGAQGGSCGSCASRRGAGSVSGRNTAAATLMHISLWVCRKNVEGNQKRGGEAGGSGSSGCLINERDVFLVAIQLGISIEAGKIWD